MFMARKEFLEDKVPASYLESFHYATLHSKCVVLNQGGHCGVILFSGGGDAILDRDARVCASHGAAERYGVCVEFKNQCE